MDPVAKVDIKESSQEVPVADLHRNNNLSSELYEVKRYLSSGVEVSEWELLSDSLLDIQDIVARNNKIQFLVLQDGSVNDNSFHKYTVRFHRTFRSNRVRRMFPGCFVFPVPQVVLERNLVRFDPWNNVYVPE